MINNIFLIIGSIGTFLLALSGLPQAIKSIKDGHAKGMAHGTVIFWLTGEFSMLLYALYFYQRDYILLINYFANFILVGIIFKFKYFGTK